VIASATHPGIADRSRRKVPVVTDEQVTLIKFVAKYAQGEGRSSPRWAT
jgi:hypothetical protein